MEGKPQQREFEDFYLSDDILEALADIGYDEPTEVQREAIPLILSGIDLIVQSQTGTGKTAACAIPILEMLEPHPGRVEVLVMAPTRELAKQVCREFDRIGETKGIEATAIYGGTSYEKQYEALETAQVVAATPGRLLDLLERGAIDLDTLRFFGLDEADEMLSMGFREELEAIVEYLPESRQSLLFSATATEEIEKLAEGMLFYPEYISLSSDSVAAESVEHQFFQSDGHRKPRDLVRVINYVQPENAIVFANTRADTFEVTEVLQQYGFDAETLNGELPQSEREETLGKLREDELDFLVATDVAARGIDISDLEYVIQYALPRDPEVYVHRTGRTGRIGKKGMAVSLVSPEDMASLMEIKRLYDIDIEERELPDPESIVESHETHALSDLDDELESIEFLPYGGQLGMAERLLEGDIDGIDRKRLVARLMAVTDAVLDDEALRAHLTALPDALTEGEATSPTLETPETSEPTTSRTESSGGDEETREHQPTPEQEDEPAGQPPPDETPSSTEPEGREDDTSQHEEADEPEPEPDDSLPSIGPSDDVEMSKMYMDVGRDYFDDADELQEMLCFMAGVVEEDFGDIVLKSHYSFIEVREDYFYDVINALNNEEYEDKTMTAEPARS